MRLMYVFDPRDTDGYLVRVPAILARLICTIGGRHGANLDYAPTTRGL